MSKLHRISIIGINYSIFGGNNGTPSFLDKILSRRIILLYNTAHTPYMYVHISIWMSLIKSSSLSMWGAPFQSVSKVTCQDSPGEESACCRGHRFSPWPGRVHVPWAAKPVNHSYGAPALWEGKPPWWGACTPATRESPLQQQRLNTAKNKSLKKKNDLSNWLHDPLMSQPAVAGCSPPSVPFGGPVVLCPADMTRARPCCFSQGYLPAHCLPRDHGGSRPSICPGYRLLPTPVWRVLAMALPL